MARTTGTLSLHDRIKSGTLRPGERLFIRRRSAPAIEGELQADGSIQLVGSKAVFGTPSGAAREALGVGNVDGWLRWRAPRLDDKSLADLREGEQ